MNAEQLLEHAADVVSRRRRQYGGPVELFEQVAQRWSLTLGTKVSPAHVVLCLIDLKLARLVRDPKHFDSIVDTAGYAGILQELSR
jgi:isocitrate/isopropylmalate dehydrogenase